jgi:hypothetical protein
MLRSFLVLILYMFPAHAQPQTNNAPNQPGSWLKDQHDQSDTLAIPLDSSEEEELEEEKELQKTQRPHPQISH